MNVIVSTCVHCGSAIYLHKVGSGTYRWGDSRSKGDAFWKCEADGQHHLPEGYETNRK